MLLTRIVRLSGYLLFPLSLLPALLLSFGQVVQASEYTTVLSSPYVHHLWGNDKRLSATLGTWKEVDLAYARLFPYDRARQPHPPAGCVVISTSGDRQGPGIKTTPAVLMLRCRERIDLLRPTQWVSNREQQQYRQGYLLVSMPKMGITDVHVHIVAVKSSLFNPAVLSMKPSLSRPVIGIFIRHTTNVNKYTFKETITGKLERIDATPNHPFYVVNQHRYIPVSHLSPYDKLVNVQGHPITLVCPKGKFSHCGQPYHPGQVITVYNLEVYGQHRYFVGKPGILVHNGYDDNVCRICQKKFEFPSALKRHMPIHSDDKPFACNACSHRFKRPNELRRHVKYFHSRGKNIACKFCDKTFVWPEGLRSHNIHIHKENLDDASLAASGPSESSESSGTEQVRERSRSPINLMISEFSDLPQISPFVPSIPSMPSMDGNQFSAQLSKIVDDL